MVGDDETFVGTVVFDNDDFLDWVCLTCKDDFLGQVYLASNDYSLGWIYLTGDDDFLIGLNVLCNNKFWD